jgi:hypothetical protein
MELRKQHGKTLYPSSMSYGSIKQDQRSVDIQGKAISNKVPLEVREAMRHL